MRNGSEPLFSLSLLLIISGFYAAGCLENCYCYDSENICYSCKEGYWGKTCSFQCPVLCLSDNCEQKYRSLIGLISWLFVTSCKKRCNETCALGVCDQKTGSCSFSCQVGYVGKNCDSCAQGFYGNTKGTCQKCPKECYSCSSGKKCNKCNKGFWGEACQLKCPSNCPDFECKQRSGHCVHDCEAGLWGNICNNTCPLNCKFDKCDSSSGLCKNGCKNNFYGDKCSMACETTCLSGEKGLKCNDTNGRCLQNCQDGYYGDSCQEICSGCVNETCYKNNGSCIFGNATEEKNTTQALNDLSEFEGSSASTSTSNTFVAIGVGVIAAVVFIVIGIIFVSKKRKRIKITTAEVSDSNNQLSQAAFENKEATEGQYEQLRAGRKNSHTYSGIEVTSLRLDNRKMDIHLYTDIAQETNYDCLQNRSNDSKIYSNLYSNII